ncbi:MAG: RuvB-like domain-containing protein, partial [Candidatus Methanomethylicia archaeon]
NLRIGRSLLFREEEISDEVRQKVDEEVQKAVGRGEAKLIPGVLFIDEAHMLDVEAFSFLNRALEQEFAPVLVLATNRAMARVKGTDVIAPHGIPIDMLDRLLIAKTNYPTRDEIRRIVEIRASTEGIELSPEALNLLADIGEKLSLRHAVRLIAPAKAVADIENSSVVKPEHIERAKSVFIDVRESVQYMQEVLKKDPLFLEFLK